VLEHAQTGERVELFVTERHLEQRRLAQICADPEPPQHRVHALRLAVDVQPADTLRPARQLREEDPRAVSHFQERLVGPAPQKRRSELEARSIEPSCQRLEVVVDWVVGCRLRHERSRRQRKRVTVVSGRRTHSGSTIGVRQQLSVSKPPVPDRGPRYSRDASATEDSHLAEVAGFFDEFAARERRWRRRNRTYYRLIESIHRFLIPEGTSILEIGSGSGDLLASLQPSRALGVDLSQEMVELARSDHPDLEFVSQAGERFCCDEKFDYVILSDLTPFAFDLEAILENVRSMTRDRSRVVIHSYSQLWRPVIRLAEFLGLKPKKPIHNWVTPNDLRNLLELTGFEVISVSRQILIPKKVPFLTTLLNGVVARIWPLSHLALTWWVVARPKPTRPERSMSVSIVVPCRNEAGMIEEIIERVPDVGSDTEIIFVEGWSRDETRSEIERQMALHPHREISVHSQSGAGKGDAVRLGFENARNELLMILDADLTVSPEDLGKFYRAIHDGHADFANGSRLVYDMQPGAMQFLNLIGNKFFSAVFSSLLEQPVKDTLCGTKVLRKSDYEAIVRSRAYFGDFDPFGDFDLLLGAARQRLRIVDIPIRYSARTYGKTNISRFHHGWLLLKMAGFGFYKLKIKPVRV
jgi:SAM-dependent methyltransferase